MASDLDNVLQSLEQQVKDFSLDITQTETIKPSSSCHHVSSLERKQKARNKQDSDDDDDHIIGHLLQTVTVPTQQKVSPKSLGLARSLSAGARKFPKKLLPDEPVPSMPVSPSLPPPPPPSSSLMPAIDQRQRQQLQQQQQQQKENDDLQQAMQLAWAVLDAGSTGATETPSSQSSQQLEMGVKQALPASASQQQQQKQQQQQNSQHHQQQQQHYHHSSSTVMTPTATMTTRIFIEDAKNHKTVQLTNVLTAAMVIQYLKRRELLDNSDDWTLFEIANSHGVERPLRLWEVVMDITSCWEQNANNALLVKKYGFYDTLTVDTIREKPSPVHGWLNIEYKKGKWQKRYCFIKDHAIHHAKDSKCSNSAILCHLPAFDVYTLLQPCTTSPTPFVFALRAQDRSAIFEKEEDYMRLFTAENQASLESWVLGIRQAKSIIQYQQHPKRVLNPLAALTVNTASASSATNTTVTTNTTTAATSTLHPSNETNLRRHKSMKLETTGEDGNSNHVEGRPRGLSRSESSPRRITDEAIKRKASTRGLTRSGTARNREHHHHEAKETNGNEANPDEKNSTLIQLDDKVHFSKGSLLDKNTSVATPASSSATSSISVATTLVNSPTSPLQTQYHHAHHPQQQQQQPHSGNPSMMVSRSKSTRETSSSHYHHQQHRSRGDEGILSHHASIRRKERGQRQHDVPLPNTNAIMTTSFTNPLSATSPSRDNTLLKLNDTPERFHTQTLLQRQMKPLLNFDQDVTSDHRR